MAREITRTHRGIYGYVKKENKVLLIVKKRGPYTGMYDLPGGSPESGETEEQTLVREFKEETGCQVTSYKNRQEKIVTFENFVEDDGRAGYLVHTGILFECEVSGTPDDTISDLDSNGALWIDISQLNANNATPLVLTCCEMYKI